MDHPQESPSNSSTRSVWMLNPKVVGHLMTTTVMHLDFQAMDRKTSRWRSYHSWSTHNDNNNDDNNNNNKSPRVSGNGC
eukprot:2835757-Amphidinium_carterae.1